ncbi:hypothetical protein ACF09E_31350 [Streptomyces sp. NPDC014891]|uniref:hypothetical protein n=1 Tax=Streptomyces sp. NPDC014891 TaxID=3364929 RepID=UPI0036FCB9F6
MNQAVRLEKGVESPRPKELPGRPARAGLALVPLLSLGAAAHRPAVQGGDR